MTLRDMVVPNENFQTSINIDFDFGSEEKVKALIPTDSVCRYLEEIIRDVIVNSGQRAKLLVGAYGKGKSHVVLAALTAMWNKNPAQYDRIIEAYRERGLEFGDTFKKFVTEGKHLLPVIISGSTSDLRHSLLTALRNALRLANLDNLMPQTNYDGAIRVFERWKRDYPDTITRFEDLAGTSAASIVSRLKRMDTSAYDMFVEAYPALTSGSTFDVLDGAEVIAVYEHVLADLECQGVDGVYVVYDEFSKYLETSLDRATFEDAKLLQDFAEACNRSGNERQLHLLLISHKSLSNYIDSNLPREKVDGWRGVSGRFREIAIADDPNQYYELLGSAITKDGSLWDSWLEEDNGTNDRKLNQIGGRYVSQGLFNSEVSYTVTHGCYPLHPLTTYLLVRMSEKLAQNERTLFTFICSNGENTLRGTLERNVAVITPDCVYAYFEPLLRKEFYTSPLHKTYELARSSLRRVESESLEANIIRTIAAIDIVAQYDRVAPTRQTIVDIYSDAGYDALEVDAALDVLVANDSIVYLKRSNAFLKLKETSGVRVDIEVADRAETLRVTRQPTQILNDVMKGRALYPSRYNEDKGMVRYFDCGFASSATLRDRIDTPKALGGNGDGEVVAIYTNSADDFACIKDFAKDQFSLRPMTVVVFSRTYIDITDALYRLEAAQQLKHESSGDDVLTEEYEIIVEDCDEIVDDFIAGFFQPELGRSLYFIGGVRKNKVTRRSRLSEELSGLCDATYAYTPRITSEALNKRELTGTAFSSRTKILKALCARNLEPNLGFIGNGQETSMARSALEKTGILENLKESATRAGKQLEHGMNEVLGVIRNFIESADDAPLSDLYGQLIGPELGIGLREGPIPIYLAWVLREYRDEIKITYDGKERQISETLLDDISKYPSSYRLTRLNWTPQMAAYVANLASLFGCNSDASRNDVADAIRLWYVELPQVTRNSKYDHTATDAHVPLSTCRFAFFRAIRQVKNDSNTFLFKELPRAFNLSVEDHLLIDTIRMEKEKCDDYLSELIDKLIDQMKSMFDPNAHRNMTLGSVLRDWIERNPATTTHVFSGMTSHMLGAVKTVNGDDRVTVNRLAKAATSLRVEDWNDARFFDFIRTIRKMRSEVEGAGSDEKTSEDGRRAGIIYVDEDGKARQKTFELVECGARSRLLKNNILASLSEMGGALRPEEKRQIVFEVLEGLC